jgi:hypothetical protein
MSGPETTEKTNTRSTPLNIKKGRSMYLLGTPPCYSSPALKVFINPSLSLSLGIRAGSSRCDFLVISVRQDMACHFKGYDRIKHGPRECAFGNDNVFKTADKRVLRASAQEADGKLQAYRALLKDTHLRPVRDKSEGQLIAEPRYIKKQIVSKSAIDVRTRSGLGDKSEFFFWGDVQTRRFR